MRQMLLAALGWMLAAAAHAGVDANQASQAELESVKGIGPGVSERLLAARQQARFKDWSDLIQRVPGIGPAKAAELSARGLTVDGQAFTLPAR